MSSRDKLIAHMTELENRGINCAHCSGQCCTYSKNSMKISDKEAQTIATYVNSRESTFRSMVIKEIDRCIVDYRLDKFIQMKPSLSLRHYYTCSFYLETNGALGCVLPRSVRPIGCLAFNPITQNANQQSQCMTLGEWKKSSMDETESIPIAVKKILGDL